MKLRWAPLKIIFEVGLIVNYMAEMECRIMQGRSWPIIGKDYCA